jgi:hypothetical protein
VPIPIQTLPGNPSTDESGSARNEDVLFAHDFNEWLID